MLKPRDLSKEINFEQRWRGGLDEGLYEVKAGQGQKRRGHVALVKEQLKSTKFGKGSKVMLGTGHALVWVIKRS